MEENGHAEGDVRIRWLGEKVCTLLKLKEDKWLKMASQEENRRTILSFLETHEEERLVFYMGRDRDELVPSFYYPDVFRKKSVVFLKKSQLAVTPEAIADELVFEDLTANPLEELSGLVHHVFLPLLSNPQNTKRWPEVLTQDVLSQFQTFSNEVAYVLGKTKGETKLAMPAVDSLSKEDMVHDRSVLHSLESAVVGWSREVKKMIEVESELALREAEKRGEFPGPSLELDFWAGKLKNLRHIHSQLCDEKVRKLVSVLETTRSSYLPGFQKLMTELEEALEEAGEVSACLETLRKHLSQLEQAGDMEDVLQTYRPIMHITSLIWLHSKYYNTPSRIIVLLKEVCNDIITQGMNCINGNSVLRDEFAEGLEKLNLASDVCGAFKRVYFEYKSKLTNENPHRAWRFDNSLIFSRLDRFLERVHDVRDLVMFNSEFLKLEKVEIGGGRGKSYRNIIENVWLEFQDEFKVFEEAEYEILDVEDDSFSQDFSAFCIKLKDFDRRLCYVIDKGFSDCATPYAGFKLLESFESQISRDMIKKEVEAKFVLLLGKHEEDIDLVAEIVKENKTNPPILSNLPQIAGTLAWTDALAKRISWPMEKFQSLQPTLLETEEGKSVTKKYEQLMKTLREIESLTYDKWTHEVETVSFDKLKDPLLKRNPSTSLLALNFDSALSSCIQEVKYLKTLNIEKPVPDSATEIYGSRESFRQYIENLKLMIGQYNTIMTTLVDVEKPLVRERIEQIDSFMEQGIVQLNWYSEGIPDFIENTRGIVKDLYMRLNFLKGNVKTIEKTLNGWQDLGRLICCPPKKDAKTKETVTSNRLVEIITFWRPEDKVDSPQKTPSKKVFAKWRQKTIGGVEQLSDIVEQGHKIHKLLSASCQRLEVNRSSAEWRAYVSYVNEIVADGVFRAVKNAFLFLIRNMECVEKASNKTFESVDPKKSDTLPLIKVRFDLANKNAQFTPDIDGKRGSIQEKVENWVNTMYQIAARVNRLDNPVEDYTHLINSSAEVSNLRDRISQLQDLTVEKMEAVRREFDSYSYLYTEDRTKFLDKFLSGEYLQRVASESTDEEVVYEKPKLEDFEEQILRFENVLKELDHLPKKVHYGWILIDSEPMRQALATEAQHWRFLFVNYLDSKIKNSLEDMEKFIEVCSAGMKQEVPSGNYEKLVEVMGHMSSFRKRTDSTEAMFEPLKEIVQLLKKYGRQMPEDILQMLEDGPEKWSSLKKTYYAVREVLAPLQAEQVQQIQVYEDDFNRKMQEFRKEFAVNAPFTFATGLEDAYEKINELHKQVSDFERELAKLCEKLELFELMENQGYPIKECRAELKLLKTVWDVVGLVQYQLSDWKQVPFLEIDVEFMEMEAKKMNKEIRGLDKRVRTWDCFTGLDGMMKNFVVSLPLVTQLRNPAMRDRHWRELMRTTGVKFSPDESFKLEDLLQLELHRYVADVEQIVECAVKEMAMEKSLKDIEKNWRTLEIEFGKHKETDIPTIKVPEEVIETLETDQVQVQNMLTSKFIGIFEEEVNSWQKKLGIVDSVINLFMEVQRTWAYLENIFIGSEDIRKQLPEDSKRFDDVDVTLKDLLKDTSKTPNVLEACLKDHLEDSLSNLRVELSKCEKRLDEYLETKKKAFPRFYFVSVPDLLDILSKGGQSPHDIMEHMPKLFQAMKTLEFEEDKDGNKTNFAKGMISREGEYVSFESPIELTGQVEVWLNKVVGAMKAGMRHHIGESYVHYEELPRHEWLFNWPAQVVIVISEVYWTSEVTAAFDALDEGNENALKDYSKKQIEELNKLIHLVQGELEKGDRQKIMSLVTIDVHSRDVVQNLIRDKVENAAAFGWQSQLRLRWDERARDIFINICDAEFVYGYEYLGNGPRLVITPLTDRIYITLTQSLHLVMGGAPAGPAGTGKTETVKDLGSQLGKPVYVFNCSDQMDYKSLGDIFKGLASSGSWGCFDEFNRIAVEVLSVVSTQFKSVLDSIRERRPRLNFQGEEISLDPTVGVFITMNPGYLGRTELPDSLKALFRPVTVVVPDLELICENMLMAEGFLDAKVLAKKFITLYQLNADLLRLRAIKSVLVVAGGLKRAEPHIPEEHILMRALRDFNKPKIVTEDEDVFMGLLGDLFPGVNLPRKQDIEFEKVIRDTITELNWQPEDNLVLKCVQLEELLYVRHSIFIIGPSGAGKSVLWKSLAGANTKRGNRTLTRDLNPKAITSNELYGYFNEATKEWKDGLLSTMMKDLGRMPDTNPKWIILDGDLDTEWIESMNSVMDDNKILTLANNDRIPLLPHMRLLFEISHLKYATPATVSRAGIIYMSDTEIGWMPYVLSWIDRRENANERSVLTNLFTKYAAQSLEVIRKQFKTIIPISDFNMIQSLCVLLDGLLPQIPEDRRGDPGLTELYFVFACVWAFGSCITFKDGVDYRTLFNRWWRTEWKTVKFPEGGLVFDYYITKDHTFDHWEAAAFDFNSDIAVSNMVVSTIESVCWGYFMNMVTDMGRPFMLVGNAGSGKTKLVEQKLSDLKENYIANTINFNYYTDALMLQNILEAPLEKKGGKNYGPPGAKKLIYFIDDLNMPAVDKYGTQSPIALLRQHFDYSHWYDRTKLTLKVIRNVQYIASMNPTAGSFFVNPRLQRHFVTFAVSVPAKTSLKRIYSSILNGHLKAQNFPATISKVADRLLDGVLAMHEKVSSTFVKTAIKFHYEFNLRHISNVFEGMLASRASTFTDPNKFIRLWIHETTRVYRDRLMDVPDQQEFDKVILKVVKETFPEAETEELMTEPLIFSHFAGGVGEKVYNEVPSFESLHGILSEALNDYNEENAVMNLVLFEDAMSHVCRISRIIEQPQGNALLVGVGGSGKQSLSRLAAFIAGYIVHQITISRTYGVNELKEDLAFMYRTAGLKGEGIVFLFTDSQIVDERFLVFINDLLSSGNIVDLFPPEEKEEIINKMRNEVKQAGLLDTRETCWDFFIDKVRRNLHCALCFSPVGDAFRVRSRKFPALVNCTIIDWFFPWPKEALLSVADRFVSDVPDLGTEEVKKSIVEFIAFTHESVNEASAQYKEIERRFNYTTPKSFLEMISLYKSMLERKRKETVEKIERLENGLIKLQKTSKDVSELEEMLKKQQVVVEEKKEKAQKLLVEVSSETEVVEKEKDEAKKEEEKTAVIQKDVEQAKEDADRDLARAEPMVQAALAALNTLNKANLTELKSFKKPPGEVADVMSAVLILLSPPSGVVKDKSWAAVQKTMGNVDQFLKALVNYDKENVPAANLKQLEPYLANPNFKGELVRSKSVAAAGICDWVVNIVAFYQIHCEVEPKRIRLREATAELEAANSKLAAVKKEVAELEAKLKVLTDQFEQANEEKMRVVAEAEATQKRLELAQRLIKALGSENVRWSQGVETLKMQFEVLVGDILLSSAFVSYVGCFNARLRKFLVADQWIPRLNELKIPMTENIDVLSLLTDDAEIATWNNEKLPADRVSVENGVIFTNCMRWPLIIDPQLQGIAWIKTREEQNNLHVVRLGQKKMMDTLERAIENGDPVLIENIGESVDAVLGPVIGRNIQKKGHDYVVRLGDKEVYYNKNFRLMLHTKLSNPHYKPELQAETTLINFTVTEGGLEDQLLALVVKKERPDLEEQKAELIHQQNEFKIRLKELEENVLGKLAKAEGDILGDVELIENLELTKKTANEISEKVKQAGITEKDINAAREHYRPVAARGSLLYFLLDSLSRMEYMYQYSLNAFEVVFSRAIDQTQPSEELQERIENLLDSITYSVFSYARRGLFEAHKLIFAAQLAFRIDLRRGNIDGEELNFLLVGRKSDNPPPNPLSDWLADAGWATLHLMKDLENFQKIVDDVESSAKRWREWSDLEMPEKEKLPGEWKNRSTFQKLLIVRAFRPDRITAAVREYVIEVLEEKYVYQSPFSLESTFFESSPSTPLLFILFPGADPVKEVEALARKLGFTEDQGKFTNVSMGQNQESVAERAMDRCHKEGGWVMLQNIHLMEKWLPILERKLELYAEGSHKDFRVFLTAEPAGIDARKRLPQGILQSSIKIANEPPQTLKANMHRAWANFNQDKLESSMKQNEFKSILFALCFFHALVLGRRKFGFQGWSRSYSFNTGDLTISADVLFNYLEASNTIPWEDIRYIFGEIMYGGHITDKWDRRTCSTYLETLMNDQLFEGLDLAPGFPCPAPANYNDYVKYIDEDLPPENPNLFGLHSNAELKFLTSEAEILFRTILDLEGSGGGGLGMSREEKVKGIVQDIGSRLPDNPLDVNEITGRVEQKTPYISVLLQECDRMNLLLNQIKISLKELEMGLNGELTISEQMDEVINALFTDRVPDSWAKVAYPSLKSMGDWFADLLERVQHLQDWAADLNLPKTVWISGLFNPMSFLTSVMQTTARKNDWPLDKMVLQTEVTKKSYEDITAGPTVGAYIHGMFLEGARWDVQSSQLRDSYLKELHPLLPVMHVKAVTVDKKETKGVYECPVYVTSMRGPTFVFTATLRTSERPSKWVLAGVALLLSPD